MANQWLVDSEVNGTLAIVSGQNALHRIRELPFLHCKQFSPALPKTQRHKHLLLSSNIKETNEIAKQLISQVKLLRSMWDEDLFVLYFVTGARGCFFTGALESILPDDISTGAWVTENTLKSYITFN